MKKIIIALLTTITLFTATGQAGIFKKKPKPAPVPQPRPTIPPMPTFIVNPGIFHQVELMSKTESCSQQVRIASSAGTIFLSDTTNYSSKYNCSTEGETSRFNFVFNESLQRWHCVDASGSELTELSATELVITYKNGTSTILEWVAPKAERAAYFKRLDDYGWNSSTGNCTLRNGSMIPCSSITFDVIASEGLCEFSKNKITDDAVSACKSAGNIDCQVIDFTLFPHLHMFDIDGKWSRAIGCYSKVLVRGQ